MGFRFEGALFKSHPEFSGAVRGRVIAPGRLLVTAESVEEEESDPVLASFLAFIQDDMARHPESLAPLDESLSKQIASLVGDVKVDKDEDLGDEIVL